MKKHLKKPKQSKKPNLITPSPQKNFNNSKPAEKYNALKNNMRK